MLDDLFNAIDAKDSKAFAAFFSGNCRFRFGNLSEVTGVENVRDFVAGFFDSVASLSHEISESWSIPGGLVCHGRVTYERKDGSSLTVPFSNILKMDSAGVCEYLIFADTSQLYQ